MNRTNMPMQMKGRMKKKKPTNKKVKKLAVGGDLRGGPPGFNPPGGGGGSAPPGSMMGGTPPGFGGTPPGFGPPASRGGARGSVENIRDTSAEALEQLAQASLALGDGRTSMSPFKKGGKVGGKTKKSKKNNPPRGYGIAKRGIRKTKYL